MASQRKTDVILHFPGPLYGVGLLFFFLPIIDVVTQVWPPAPGNPGWRYGLIGLGANYLISVLFGLLLICLAAGAQWHRRTLRVLAIWSAFCGVLCIVGTLAFVLDALQLRPAIPKDNTGQLRMFDVGAAKAVFKYLISAVVFGWIGLASWRGAREIPTHAAEDVPKLVSRQAE